MEYRPLGATGAQVSVIGMGAAMLGNSTTDYGVRLVERELALGVNYFDTAAGYGDSEVKLGLALQDVREQVFLSTKTQESARDAAWAQINRSLERLRTDHVDNLHVHALEEYNLDARLGHEGTLAAVIRAKEEGLARHVGCTSHRSDLLLRALERYPFEVILIPMNIVEREPLERLIPVCLERGVGITIMKPLGTGLFPAPVALRWLRTQPIATAVPGVSTLEEVDEDLAAGEGPAALSPEEERQITAVQAQFARVRCRLCARCLPCPVGIPIDIHLGTDMVFDHYRTMGPEGFRAYPWGRVAMQQDLAWRRGRIAAIEACTRCGVCNARCPYGLDAMGQILAMLPAMRDIVSVYEARLAS